MMSLDQASCTVNASKRNLMEAAGSLNVAAALNGHVLRACLRFPYVSQRKRLI